MTNLNELNKLNEAKPQVTIADYLITRLAELGVRQIFGVPGDFTLRFLDYIEESDLLNWVGNCNELNAAYSADGYAKIVGFGVVLTTAGVGELSAINGISGSYAENIALIHIVGMPATQIQQRHLPIHHTFADGDYNKFIRMQESVTCAQEILEIGTAALQIDRALISCWQKQKPVVIGVASDLFDHLISAPQQKLTLELQVVSAAEIAKQASQIASILKCAKQPLIILDGQLRNFNLAEAACALIDSTQLPFASTLATKGIKDENSENFIGVYFGNCSSPELQEYINGSDCVLWFCYFDSDINSARYSTIRDSRQIIKICHNQVDIFGELLASNGDGLCRALSLELGQFAGRSNRPIPQAIDYSKSYEVLSHDSFWSWVQTILRADSVIVVEAGTSLFGIAKIKLPNNVIVVNQLLWSSIGYTVGATTGVLAANTHKNVYLFIGDGAFQQTAQEVSTMLRYGYRPIIFLINNNGYTIERYIHGAKMHYNDIAEWNYCQLVASFAGQSITRKITDLAGLHTLATELKGNSQGLWFIEVCLDEADAPQNMSEFFAI